MTSERWAFSSMSSPTDTEKLKKGGERAKEKKRLNSFRKEQHSVTLLL